MSITKYIDPKISIGNILAGIMLAGTLVGMWKTSEIRLAELTKDRAYQDRRIENLESNQEKLTDSQNKTALVLERVAAKVDMLEKRPPNRYEP